MIKFKIGNRIISENHEPLVIAEIGINHNGNFAVSDTAMYGCLDVLDYLIKQGVELNYDPKEETLPFNYPVTPLMAGISASDHYKVTELLLKAGADPNIYEINGETPLHKARIYQKKDTEDLLVKWGAVEPIITEEEKFNMDAKVKAQNDHYDQKQRKEKDFKPYNGSTSERTKN